MGWIGEKSMCCHLVCVGVFSESERRDIWWVGLGVKGHGRCRHTVTSHILEATSGDQTGT